MVQRYRAFYEGKMYGVKAVIWTSRGLYVTLDEGNKAGRRVRGAKLMQSTGLFDKQGYGIWEGDVVEFEDADDIENVYINRGVIEWCQGGFTVSNRTNVTLDDLLDGDKLEVTIIGNIYENPELVEGVE